jgi:hypothetical protein
MFLEPVIDLADAYFEITHVYELTFLSNLIRSYQIFLIAIISQFIFYKTYKPIIVGLIITCLLSNLIQQSMLALSFDNLPAAMLSDGGNTPNKIISILPKLDAIGSDKDMDVLVILTDSLYMNKKYFSDTSNHLINKVININPIEKLTNYISTSEKSIVKIKKLIPLLIKEKEGTSSTNEKKLLNSYIIYYQRVIDFYDRKEKGVFYTEHKLFYDSKNIKTKYVTGKVIIDTGSISRQTEIFRNQIKLHRAVFISELPNIIGELYFFDFSMFSLWRKLHEAEEVL